MAARPMMEPMVWRIRRFMEHGGKQLRSVAGFVGVESERGCRGKEDYTMKLKQFSSQKKLQSVYS
jgi:hypothetical protein